MKQAGWCVCVALAGAAIASPARADVHDEMEKAAWDQNEQVARAMADVVVKAINAGDAVAFAAAFNDDGAAILPAAADEGVGRAAIEAAAKRWFATLKKPKIKLDQLHVPMRPGSAEGAWFRPWFDGELVDGTLRWRISGVLYPAKAETEAPFKLGALHISEAVDDKAALAAAAAGKLPALPVLGELDQRDEPDHLVTMARTFAGHVYNHGSVALTGSAPKEHVFGKPAVTKLLAAWRNLKLANHSLLRPHFDDMWGTQWYVGHVDATFTVDGKPVVVPYRALMVYQTYSGPAIDHGAHDQLLLAHFSVATR